MLIWAILAQVLLNKDNMMIFVSFGPFAAIKTKPNY